MVKIIQSDFERLFALNTKEEAKQFLWNNDFPFSKLIVFKTEAHEIFAEEAIHLPAYQSLMEAITLAHNNEISTLQNDLLQQLSKMRVAKALEIVESLQDSYSDKEYLDHKEAQISLYIHGIPLDSKGDPFEPLAFYTEANKILTEFKNKLAYQQIKNTIPIKDRLMESLSDFPLPEWKKRVEGEVANSTNYYIALLNDLIQIRDERIDNHLGLIISVKDPFTGEIIHHNRLLEIIDWISLKINHLNTRQQKIPIKFPCSFTLIPSLSKPQIIESLFNLLKTNGFIALDTHLPNFRKIWIGEPISKKIIWTGTISELAFFIRYLISDLKIIQKVPNRSYWNIVNNCFNNLKKTGITKNQLKNAKKPSLASKIREICTCIKLCI